MVEYDKYNEKIDHNRSLSIEKSPKIMTKLELQTVRTHMGSFYMQEEDVAMDIYVWREPMMQHLAFIGGLNFFWSMIMWCFLKCWVTS